MVKGWARLRIQVRSLFLEVVAETVQQPSSHGLPRCFVLALRLLTTDKPWIDPLDHNKNLTVTGFVRNNDIHELRAYSSELLDLLPQMGEALVTIYTPTLQRLQMAVGALRDAVLMPSGLHFAIRFGVSLQIADTSLKHEAICTIIHLSHVIPCVPCYAISLRSELCHMLSTFSNLSLDVLTCTCK